MWTCPIRCAPPHVCRRSRARTLSSQRFCRDLVVGWSTSFATITHCHSHNPVCNVPNVCRYHDRKPASLNILLPAIALQLANRAEIIYVKRVIQPQHAQQKHSRRPWKYIVPPMLGAYIVHWRLANRLMRASWVNCWHIFSCACHPVRIITFYDYAKCAAAPARAYHYWLAVNWYALHRHVYILCAILR